VTPLEEELLLDDDELLELDELDDELLEELELLEDELELLELEDELLLAPKVSVTGVLTTRSPEVRPRATV